MIASFVASAVKSSVLLVIVVLVIHSYKCIIKPYMMYLRYKNHHNVQTLDRFNMLFGDVARNIDDLNNK